MFFRAPFPVSSLQGPCQVRYLIPAELNVGPVRAGLQAGVSHFQIQCSLPEIFLQLSDLLLHFSNFI